MHTSTRFSELLKALPRGIFRKSLEEHQSDRYAKTLKTWDILIMMLYGQLQQVGSLRTLVEGFNQQQAHHYHLGCGQTRRSTLSDALAKRSAEPFRAACEALINQMGRKQKRSLNEKISLLDATNITLRGPKYDHWSLEHKTRITQGLKIHMAIDAEQNAPVYSKVTYANVNDITAAQAMELEAQTTYVFDKGYCDYNWWFKIDKSGATFVTRLKKNANVKLVKSRPLDPEHPEILSDTWVSFGKKYLNKQQKNPYYQKTVRRIEVYRAEKDTPLILVTNDLERSSAEIAQLYKQRWQIETLFKWLKQHLKLKSYYGCSENAVRIQIYCALIAHLLMVLYRKTLGMAGTLTELAILLTYGLFQRPATERELYRRRQTQQREFQLRQTRLAL